jgi:hypothetical protein
VFSAPARVVFAVRYRIDTLEFFFHSSIPGLSVPCLRFALSLSADGVRLGVGMGHYSFNL